ncbi:MAG TPA: ATP-binding domain-containing protein [Alphaproteobacteria bacterium]|nr:ATP-binding domain-containing protein [Alphaproteobacteria bacterium]
MVSTIHKAKGLDFDHVLLCPVDRHQYSDDMLGARLLYVALSRAKRSVKLVLAADTPSRHLLIENPPGRISSGHHSPPISARSSLGRLWDRPISSKPRTRSSLLAPPE